MANRTPHSNRAALPAGDLAVRGCGSGLLDVLVPAFERASGYQVKTIAVGTGAALAMGERGDADVLLVHAPGAEEAYMAKDRGLSRALVMHNAFTICAGADRGSCYGVLSSSSLSAPICIPVTYGEDFGSSSAYEAL